MRQANANIRRSDQPVPPASTSPSPVSAPSNIVDAWNNSSFGPESREVIARIESKSQTHVELVRKAHEALVAQFDKVL
ncbi:MAG: hypothetical protein KDD62_11915, partial [Bdellovibrionales bacterium]|nr:hypothetical protein [Bdellovibrionales bacterium]